ncbi:hypothetical protein WA026_014974 [Henosepilachna vigintioctopunctata]|uniref:Elongation of very long chain fatty acids protein n=1 Tax=Henosepilachna vigintioctopunctata TaxID=420089 RepID=A0AAW1U9Z5_9CUCU
MVSNMFLDLDKIINENADPRVNQYYIMTSVWKPIILTVMYLVFVHLIGPWYMKNRPPYNLKKTIMFFDFFQVVFNLHIFYSIIICFLRRKPGLCLEVDYSNSEIGLEEMRLSHFYFLLKLLDILDTIFFVLKKSFRQMTFLHIYHHAMMILLTWFSVKYVPGGQTGVFALLNTFVHFFMYLYYFLTAYNPATKHWMFLKRSVTIVQLFQFIVCFLVYGYTLIGDCNFNKTLCVLYFTQSVFFIYLFSKFFYKNYMVPEKMQKRTD